MERQVGYPARRRLEIVSGSGCWELLFLPSYSGTECSLQKVGAYTASREPFGFESLDVCRRRLNEHPPVALPVIGAEVADIAGQKIGCPRRKRSEKRFAVAVGEFDRAPEIGRGRCRECDVLQEFVETGDVPRLAEIAPGFLHHVGRREELMPPSLGPLPQDADAGTAESSREQDVGIEKDTPHVA
jgi:hypothetical protein